MTFFITNSYALAGEYVYPGPPYAMPLINNRGKLSVRSKSGLIYLSELYQYSRELYDHIKGIHVIHEETLKSSYKTIRKAFEESFSKHVKVLWAVKSLPVRRVLRVLSEEGIDGVDIASPQEALLAASCGIPMEWSTYTAPSKNELSLKQVLKTGAIDIVDSLDELSLVAKLSRNLNLDKPKIGIRVNPEIEADLPHQIFTASPRCKFGVPLNYAKKLIHRAEEMGLAPSLIHLHIGSQVPSPEIYDKALARLSEALKEIDIRVLDIGGGLPFDYMSAEQWNELKNQGYSPKFKSHVETPLKTFIKELSKAVKEYFSSIETLILEPGRAIVAGAMSTCGEVLGFKYLGIKHDLDVGWVISTVSVNELHHKLVEPDLFHHIILADKLDEKATTASGVGGDLCFTGDVLTPTNVFLKMPPQNLEIVYVQLILALIRSLVLQTTIDVLASQYCQLP